MAIANLAKKMAEKIAIATVLTILLTLARYVMYAFSSSVIDLMPRML